MKTILTCASCGATEAVEDTAEAKRSKTCSRCGGPAVEKRHPGTAL